VVTEAAIISMHFIELTIGPPLDVIAFRNWRFIFSTRRPRSLQGLRFPAHLLHSEAAVEQRNSEWYRTQAAHCTAWANNATDHRIKALNQAEAERWLRLAEVTEKSEKQDQNKQIR
jgi:hypothetical protein